LNTTTLRMLVLPPGGCWPARCRPLTPYTNDLGPDRHRATPKEWHADDLL
jgi:hypothetical protein